jgi:hypothetical protein
LKTNSFADPYFIDPVINRANPTVHCIISIIKHFLMEPILIQLQVHYRYSTAGKQQQYISKLVVQVRHIANYFFFWEVNHIIQILSIQMSYCFFTVISINLFKVNPLYLLSRWDLISSSQSTNCSRIQWQTFDNTGINTISFSYNYNSSERWPQ